MPVIEMNLMSAEEEHEIDAYETDIRLRKFWKKWRDEGLVPSRE